jgi:PleD family two-component response regulator
VRTELTSLLNHFLADRIIDVNDLGRNREDVQQSSENATAVKVPAIEKEVKKLDILLAKKSPIETKLFSMLLDELKFNYLTSTSFNALLKDIKAKNPRMVLVDKEMANIDYSLLKETVDGLPHKTAIVMMVDPASRENTEHNEIADEIINNLVNKDLLRLIVEKYTK